MPDFPAVSPIERDELIAIVCVLAAAAFAAILKSRLFALAHRLASRNADGKLAAFVRRTQRPSSLIFPLIAVELTLLVVHIPEWIRAPFLHLLGLCIIAAVAWALIALIGLGVDLAKRGYALDAGDNLRARRAETRLDILYRSGTTIVGIVTVGLMLMTFPAIRAIGEALLASAGLLGLAVGVAARPFLENLVAGIQIALAQPIRIDDVVVVNGQQGRIERLTATFVVLRLVDLRRMIVPLSYFTNTPFENWTFEANNLIGSVMLYVDASVSLDDLRAELDRVLDECPLWDGQTKSVAMTDVPKDAAPEVRVLVSARDATQLFDLRAVVREKLVGWLAARTNPHVT